MAINVSIRPCVLLMGIIAMIHFPSAAFAMDCQTPLGVTMGCPTVFNDNDKVFCCYSNNNIPYCCDIGDFIGNNTAVIAGVIVVALIILLIITLCCCCFCSCCLIAKRRVNRGTVYGPVTASQPVSSTYPLQPSSVVHTPPPATQYPPQPGTNAYYSPPNPNVYPAPPYSPNYQPPLNPNYPHP